MLKEKLRQINKEAFQAIDPAVLSQLTPEERLRFSPTPVDDPGTDESSSRQKPSQSLRRRIAVPSVHINFRGLRLRL
jgi:hypothetical protein